MMDALTLTEVQYFYWFAGSGMTRVKNVQHFYVGTVIWFGKASVCSHHVQHLKPLFNSIIDHDYRTDGLRVGVILDGISALPIKYFIQRI